MDCMFRQVAEQGLDLFPRNPQLHFHLANSLGKLVNTGTEIHWDTENVE